MNKELEALDELIYLAKEEASVGEIGGLLDHSKRYDEAYRIVEQALLKYGKLCKVINEFYEMAHGEVKYKFDSKALADFSDALKQLIERGIEE